MTEIANGENGLSVRTKLNTLLAKADSTKTVADQAQAGADASLKIASDLSDLSNAATARTNLGVVVGSDVQAWSAVLDATTASFTTADETKLDGVEALADVTDAANVTAAGAHMAGGADVPVDDGGTGASTASAARTNLGVVVGTDVQAWSGVLDTIIVAEFATTAAASAASGFIDGQYATVSAGYNGERETFQYVSASTLTADGALVLASAMATGRLISTRTVYADYAEAKADVRTFTAGTVLAFSGITGTLTAKDTSGTWGEANAGGQNFNAHSVINTVELWGTTGDGTTDDTDALQRALDAGAGGIVYFPTPASKYLTTGLTVATDTTAYGDGASSLLEISGTKNIIEIFGLSGGTQTKNVTIRNLGFKGLNNMASGPEGCGVIVKYSENVTVKNCHFDSFGPGAGDASSGGAALVYHSGNIDVTIQDNVVENGTGTLNGVDISVYSAGGYALISGNRAYSTNSNGIYTDAAAKQGRIIIVNNISMNHTRHGIISSYAGLVTDRLNTIIMGNICQNCLSTGIYINGAADGAIIANNVIESCSGGGRNGYTLDGGISILGTGITNVHGNFIRNTGYDTDGVIRTIDPAGSVANDPTRTTAIRVSNGVAGVVSDNTITGGAGRGISLESAANGVRITNNSITDPEFVGIYISAINSGTQVYTISGNTIDVSGSDAKGILHLGSSSVDNGSIVDNDITGAKAGTTKTGMEFQGFGIKGKLSGNTVRSFDVGIDIKTEAMVERMGDELIADGNHFEDNTVGFKYLSDLVIYGFYTGFTFDGNGTDVSDVYGRNTVRPALSLHPVKEFYRSAAPTGDAWIVGDRAINNAPAVGAATQWTCTVAGSPGTWVAGATL